MLSIRLARHGSHKRPFYHIVVADSRHRRSGRKTEKLGYFNPIAQGQDVRMVLDLNRVSYWLSVGAQATDKAKALINEYKRQTA